MGVTCPLSYGMHYAGTLRANNFCLLVGRSGEDNKSSALNVGREILDAAAAPLIGDFPGSPEGLIDSLAQTPSQLIPISEFGKFLSSAQRGYLETTNILLESGTNRYWNMWYRDVTSRNLPNNIVGIRSRAPTIARKVALVYGWDFGPASYGKPWKMGIDVLEPAIAFTELHVKSLIDLSSVIAEHADARLRRSVLQAIDMKGGVATLGEVLGVLKMRKRPVVEILDALMEEGCVVKVQTNFGNAYETKLHVSGL